MAQCVEAFPWDVSYLIGPLGLDKSETGEHSWEYVRIVNGTWDTPIWESARRANFMLTATMALNGFIAMGVPQDWATHMIGHELTALHGLDHGVTLAIVYPGMMRVMRREKFDKLVQYAERVWGATGTPDEKVEAAITKTDEFFRSLGMKTRLSEHGVGQDTIDFIVERFRKRGWNLGESGQVTPERVAEILKDRL